MIVKQILRQGDYNAKISALIKRYDSLIARKNGKRVIPHLKKVYDTNQIYCNACGKSLEDQIGKEIVKNIKSSPFWYHLDCAIKKNMI